MKALLDAPATEPGSEMESAMPKPRVEELAKGYVRARDTRGADVDHRRRVNVDARYCLWKGKSGDGRKRGKDAFPWPNAFDCEVHLVDKYIREDTALLMTAWRRQRLQVRPTKPGRDAGWANRMTTFLRWLIYEQMHHSAREFKLAASTCLERGSSIMLVGWERIERLAFQEVTIEQLQNAALDAANRMQRGEQGEALQLQAALPDLIADPTQEDMVLALLPAMLQAVGEVKMDARAMRKSVRELRDTGVTKIPIVDTVSDRPKVTALVIGEDVFLPPEATDIQSSSAVYYRELLTETQLRERERTMGWDAQWVAYLIEHKRGVIETTDRPTSGGKRVVNLGTGVSDETANLFEIVHAYERRHDDEGVPAVWYTCFTPGYPERVAYHDTLNYDHGQYPFVEFVAERTTRRIEDSRGHGERLSTHQDFVKVQWDSRADRTSLATLPPRYRPPGDDEEESWGPGVSIPTRKKDAYGFFDTPRPDGGSIEMEQTVRQFSDEIMGRVVNEQNAESAGLMRQEMVSEWLDSVKMVFRQIMQLSQQFMPEEFWFRVVGDAKGQLLRATRDEIQGSFDLGITFNVGDLDMEFVKTKTDMLEKLAMADTNGRIDHDELLLCGIEIIDPTYAERLLRPAEEGSQRESDDEKSVLAQLLNGIPVDLKPGQAFGMRLRTLMGTIQSSPSVQGRLQQDPVAKALVEQRVKQLHFQQQQRQNAQSGKFLGGDPMEAKLREMQAGGQAGGGQ
jgi:hypothetical protein